MFNVLFYTLSSAFLSWSSHCICFVTLRSSKPLKTIISWWWSSSYQEKKVLSHHHRHEKLWMMHAHNHIKTSWAELRAAQLWLYRKNTRYAENKRSEEWSQQTEQACLASKYKKWKIFAFLSLCLFVRKELNAIQSPSSVWSSTSVSPHSARKLRRMHAYHPIKLTKQWRQKRVLFTIILIIIINNSRTPPLLFSALFRI